METLQNSVPSINFIKATIKIAHPEWSIEKIEAEAQNKLAELANTTSGENCEFCSS